jgi:glycosyltransferase involved in cell wall biosynthesis
MRILITVEYYAVANGGGIAEQARQIAERLHNFGHEVIVATTQAKGLPRELNGISIIGFSISGNAISGIRGERARYEEFLIGSNFDAIIQFAVNSWTTDVALQIADKIKSPKILSTPGLSKLGNPVYEAYYNGEYLNGLQSYEKVIYTSANYQDKIFGDNHGLEKKAVIIPNGASEQEFNEQDHYHFKRTHCIDTPHIALCVSNHFVAKGHQFVIEAFKKMNRADTTLVIIGEPKVSRGWRSIGHFILDYARCKLASLSDKRIRLFSGLSKEAVISAYKEADVFLFGSALECSPLVMYESFASKTPFVTRLVGNVADHQDVLKIVENTFSMASAGNYLIDDKESAKIMTDNAYKIWQKGYTWDIIARRYEEVCREISL